MRRRFTSAFKKKVVLAVLRGDRTLQDLAARYEVHPNQTSGWKKQAIEGLEDIFDSKSTALEEAIGRYGPPEIFNTDQGSQFTSQAFTGVLQDAGIKISMDGRGRYLDNIFIERLWRSLKYECIYLKDMTDGFVAQKEIGDWINFYNRIRPHSSLDGKTPHEVYSKAQDMGNSPYPVKQKQAA